MKKIIKYSKDSDKASSMDKLKAYQNQAKSVLSNHSEGALRSKPLSPLTAIVPLMAVALTPVGLMAQCGVSVFTPSNVLDSNNPANMTIDVDGDGTIDFELDAQTDSLFLFPQNGAEVIASVASGAYRFVTKLNAGDPITSADPNWRMAADLPSGAATMDYQASGNWDGSGTITGYVGIRIDGNRLGFMEVSWNDDSTVDEVTVTVALTGVTHPDDPIATSVGAGNCAALPVELIEFRADSKDGQTVLRWSTATEINNAGFEVQRSTDGSDFRKVGWIDGEGNSSRMLSYAYEDQFTTKNVEYYYRLKQVDIDGGFEYSNVVTTINRDESKFMLHEIFPNPSNGSMVTVNVTAITTDDLKIEVYDALGKVVHQQNVVTVEGPNLIELNVSDIVNGSYFIKVGSQGFTTYKKLVIAK